MARIAYLSSLRNNHLENDCVGSLLHSNTCLHAMLQPLGTFAVVPRHEWENRQAAVRPMQYIVIDTLGPCFDEALIRIQAETEIGVAVTGVDVGRRGKLSWIQVTGYS